MGYSHGYSRVQRCTKGVLEVLRGYSRDILGALLFHLGRPFGRTRLEHDGVRRRDACGCRSHRIANADANLIAHLIADLDADSIADLISDLIADCIADLIADIIIADLIADEYADTISRFPSRALLPLGVLVWLLRGTHRYPQATGGVLRCAVGVRERHCRGTRGVLEGHSRGL